MKQKKNVVWINTDLSGDQNSVFTGDEQREDIKSESKKAERIEVTQMSMDAMFSKHMSQYIGQTVTVYTTSAGPAGFGLTGVLLECTDNHIRLITHIGPAPEIPQRKACRRCRYYKSCMEAAERLASVGSIAEIPLHSLVIFVHNSL